MLKLLISAILAFHSFPVGVMGKSPWTGGSCTAPTMTVRYAAFNASNVCTGGCTNGNVVTAFADMAGSNNAAGSGGPTFTAAAVGGQPSIQFAGGADFQLGTDISTSVTTYTEYAVIKPGTVGTLYSISGGGASSALEWRINASGHQEILNSAVASIVTGTATISTTSYSVVAFTYNRSTGAANLYICSAGTCTSDGTATNAQTFGSALNTVGFSQASGGFVGYIAEWGYLNGTSTTGIGSYSQCKYGI